ncbi:phage terminase large subunit [Mannheimia haemolytica]|uniref:phage terminase large subunit n=1 Tax=Mannheimia haemolytica TaxID=75985 RepID=UPI00201C1770|nr:phage terminase large subunit [Mannheimia haemolytica]UQX70100.1 phage terminase large subunit [Mannheimia haemolytica]UQX70248.1 phage terminase large subunit [Mannheimia haemolytica]
MKIKEFEKELEELRRQLQQNIEASFEGWDDKPQAISERRQKVLDPVHGFEYFVQAYFPHYVRSEHKSQLHHYLFENLPLSVSDLSKSVRQAIAAPRGEAKSTICTQLFPLWCLVRDLKRYIIIAMDTKEQAYSMLEAIKVEIESNPRLRIDFPEVAQGKVWRAGVIMTAKNQKVEAVGAGQKLRGRRHGAYRPDLVVLDDIENDESVETPAQRNKLHNWVLKAVLKLGAAGEKFDVIYVGTILHYDSVLSRILNTKGWRRVRFKAILRFPDNMALWDEWENIYLSEEGDDDTMSDLFYQQHKAEMDKGALVSWLARPILYLMKIRASDGHSAFDSEYQNDPVSGDDAIFANSIQYWTELPDDLIYFGALDPSMGKAGASRDPSAILVGGYHRESGKLYVVEAQIKKRLPDLIIEDVIRLHSQYNCHRWFVETVQFQEFLQTELVKRSAQRGKPVPATATKPNSDKMLRIESLQPHIANGLILLHRSQSTLESQLRHFPKADHDDGPDALEMLWRNALSSSAPIEWESVSDDDGEYQSKWRH